MTLPQITLDVPTLKLILSIVGGLLLISMVRIVFLLRTNSRLRESTEKMEKQVLTQHSEILAVRQDSNAWRGETQRMFDAFRAEFSKRLSESEERYQDIQKRAAAPATVTAPAPTPAPLTLKSMPSSVALTKAAPVMENEETAEEESGGVTPVPALTIS